jgi:hypothetical protein
VISKARSRARWADAPLTLGVWFVFLNRHRLAHDFAPGKFADDGGILAAQQLFPPRRFFLALARDAENVAFLGAVVQRHITGVFPAAEDTDLAHPLRADAAGGQIGHAAVGELEPRVGNVFGLAQDGDADGINAGDR